MEDSIAAIEQLTFMLRGARAEQPASRCLISPTLTQISGFRIMLPPPNRYSSGYGLLIRLPAHCLSIASSYTHIVAMAGITGNAGNNQGGAQGGERRGDGRQTNYPQEVSDMQQRMQ